MTVVSEICLKEYKKYKCDTLFDVVRCKSDEGKGGILMVISVWWGFYPKSFLYFGGSSTCLKCLSGTVLFYRPLSVNLLNYFFY